MFKPIPRAAFILGLAGAVIGGTVGYFAFFWIARQGLYAIILPPSLLGLGAGLGAPRRSIPLAILCAITGLMLGLVIEWRFAPFVADRSLGFFFAHLHQLRPLTLLMIALGAVISYRLALSFESRAGWG